MLLMIERLAESGKVDQWYKRLLSEKESKGLEGGLYDNARGPSLDMYKEGAIAYYN